MVDVQFLWQVGSTQFRWWDIGEHGFLFSLQFFALVRVQEKGVRGEVMRMQVRHVR